MLHFLTKTIKLLFNINIFNLFSLFIFDRNSKRVFCSFCVSPVTFWLLPSKTRMSGSWVRISDQTRLWVSDRTRDRVLKCGERFLDRSSKTRWTAGTSTSPTSTSTRTICSMTTTREPSPTRFSIMASLNSSFCSSILVQVLVKPFQTKIKINSKRTFKI